MCFYSFEIMALWNTNVSLCSDGSYLSLNGESLQNIPMNLLVRTGLRLTHSFVWSGNMLKAQRDFSVKLRITIQWCSCFAVCASLPCHASLSLKLNHVTFKNHHGFHHSGAHVQLIKLLKIITHFNTFHWICKSFNFNLLARRKEQTPGVSRHSFWISSVSL